MNTGDDPQPAVPDVVITGNLGFAEVARLYQQKKLPFHADKTVNVDLAGVTGSGSAALALLLQWSEQANEQHAELTLHAVPEQLQSLIRTNGLDFLLQ